MRITRTLYALILHKPTDGWILSLLLLTLDFAIKTIIYCSHKEIYQRLPQVTASVSSGSDFSLFLPAVILASVSAQRGCKKAR